MAQPQATTPNPLSQSAMPAARKGKNFEMTFERREKPFEPVPEECYRVVIEIQPDVVGVLHLNVPHVAPLVTFTAECATPDLHVWVSETKQKWVHFCWESQTACSAILHIRVSEGLKAQRI